MRSGTAISGFFAGVLLWSYASAAPGVSHETSKSVDDAIQKQLHEQRLKFDQSGAATMPECTVPLAVSILRSDDPSIRTAKVQCTGPAWTLYVGFRIETLVLAPIITHEVLAGRAIGSSNFVIRNVPTDLVSGKLVPANVLRQGGVIASFDLRPGEYISFNDATVPPVVRSGEHIRVTMNAPHSGLRLATTAIALENGGMGQMIEVENRQTHRRFDAKIVRSVPQTQGVFVVIPPA